MNSPRRDDGRDIVLIRRAISVLALGVVAVTGGCNAILGIGDGVVGGTEDGGPDASLHPGSGGDGDSAADGRGDVGDSTTGGSGGDSAEASDEALPGATPCEGGPGSCLSFIPTGGLTAADVSGDGLDDFVLPVSGADGLPDGAVPGDTVIDVDNGQITSEGTVVRPASTGDPTVRDVQAGIAYRRTTNNVTVITFRSLTIPGAATLIVVGTHPVALVSSTTMIVDGSVRASPASLDGTVSCPTDFTVAPGGFAGGVGQLLLMGTSTPSAAGLGPGGGGGGAAATGGGGGHSSPGGAGCVVDEAGIETCGTAGTTYDDAPLDTPDFSGGSGGGGGGSSSPHLQGGTGGSGGGAIRLEAAVSITLSGSIDASGCGGNHGVQTFSQPGGGGAGGAIVLEAPSIGLGASSRVTAVGGAGGSSTRAGGSGYESNYACAGNGAFVSQDGAGAGSRFAPTANASAQAGDGTDCAGGGGFGWIRINARNADVTIPPGSVQVPNLATGFFSVGPLAP